MSSLPGVQELASGGEEGDGGAELPLLTEPPPPQAQEEGDVRLGAQRLEVPSSSSATSSSRTTSRGRPLSAGPSFEPKNRRRGRRRSKEGSHANSAAESGGESGESHSHDDSNSTGADDVVFTEEERSSSKHPREKRDRNSGGSFGNGRRRWGSGSSRGSADSGAGGGAAPGPPGGGSHRPALRRGLSAGDSSSLLAVPSRGVSPQSTGSSNILPLMGDAGSADVVKLNVGGKRYVTSRSTIMSKGENLLTQLVLAGSADSGPFTATRDSDGYIFIDRDGKAFAVILNFLRTGKMLPPPHMSAELLRMELDYYQLLSDDALSTLFSHSSAASTPLEGRSRSNTNAGEFDHFDLGDPRLPRATEFLGFTEKLRRTAAEWMFKNADVISHMLLDKARSDRGGVMNHPLVIQFSSRGPSKALTATCDCTGDQKRVEAVMPDINGLFLRQLEQALGAFVSPHYMVFVEGRRASGNSHVQCKFVAQPTTPGKPEDRIEALLLSIYGRIEGWNRHDVKYGGSSLSTVSGGT